jgi:hypothetical protein
MYHNVMNLDFDFEILILLVATTVYPQVKLKALCLLCILFKTLLSYLIKQ